MNRWSWVWIALCAAPLVCGCGNDSGIDPGFAGSGGGPVPGAGGIGGTSTQSCETLTNPPQSCGEPCGGDADCGDGAYCSGRGSCAAQCVTTDDCRQGFACSQRGLCIRTLGGSGGTGGRSEICEPVEVTPTRSIPNVMFLVDQSGSMTSPFEDTDRWTAAHDVIVSVVQDLDSIVRFGLTTYESQLGFENPPCPRLPTQIDIALQNGSTIADPELYPPSFPGGDDTPTGESIDALVSMIGADPPPADGPTILVVATDGEPDTCEIPNPNPTPEARAAAEAAAANAHAAGIEVFMLWVGNLDVSDPEAIETRQHLQRMANLGVGMPSDQVVNAAPFYIGTTEAELSAAFRKIIGDSISCEVGFDKRIGNRTRACEEGSVELDGRPLQCPADWRVKDNSSDSIELLGSACEDFKSEAATLSAVFPCGVVVE